MNPLLKKFMNSNIPLIEKNLIYQIENVTGPSLLKESILYSLNAGGKKIRSLLLLVILSTFNKDVKKGIEVASVIEMIHTASLICDDLPIMDNDDMRRGLPANHKVFGESVSILAGYALQFFVFGILADLEDVPLQKKIKIISLLSETAGIQGMIGGQLLDIESEEKKITLEELEHIHNNKTGELLRFSIESGAILADCTPQQVSILRNFAKHIGLAFQIKDDILDIEGCAEELGKTAGKDIVSLKNTYPSLLTLEIAKDKLHEHYRLALESLAQLDEDTILLSEIVNYIVMRNY
ncbi:polyprenyl synthetase family protein [Bacillus cereus]|uniref:polyprenyl synthetase family protein n=1 Tax=Bacillus TaxID=1386 RepID=UPI000BF6F854|nr:farnesyl diphosphate synthase [Bacillus cereus]MCU5026407.1 polyprenyl synthetase family protein [Bacillus cereus]MCU5646218.1 polyprenyl synthetase family protein [Bacillus cereus]MDA2644932.1 polyprenyl synthetase family protein [Bacillus cereus]PFA42213.1 farnesyl-diphosphate synthase [Bacillus cereus]WCT66857.1 polyprenyl synthetase family protein [Bacillus cereus]